MKKINNISKTLILAIFMIMNMVSKAQDQAATTMVMTEKKVAVLPITFIGDGNEVRMSEMKYRLQNIIFLYMKDKATSLRFQDPAETNALLLKKGVKDTNMRQFTPRELAEILEVEYVMTGMVVQENAGMSSMNNSNRKNYDNGRSKEVMSHSKTIQELNTNIDLSIYNKKGETLYSKSRRSILSDVDAYKNGLEYLLKRTPLYKK